MHCNISEVNEQTSSGNIMYRYTSIVSAQQGVHCTSTLHTRYPFWHPGSLAQPIID